MVGKLKEGGSVESSSFVVLFSYLIADAGKRLILGSHSAKNH
jgi:hypothetical protein